MKLINKTKQQLVTYELPLIGSVLIIYSYFVFFQSIHYRNLKAVCIFSFLIVLHIAFYFFREIIFQSKLNLYFFVQGIIIFAFSVVLKESSQAAYLGLIPLIIAQCIDLYKDTRKILYTTIYYYDIYCITVVIYNGFDNLLHSLSLLILISSAIIAYGYLYSKQVKTKEKTNQLLLELEAAYDKLDEIARGSERQKLARDIHDTLSQGLSGVLMQLEALEVNLEKNNIEKSKAITEKTIIQTRETLKESREIIHDLRLQRRETKNLGSAIETEIELFKRNSKIELINNQSGNLDVTSIVYKNVTYIIREVFTNISKHSKASRVILNSTMEASRITIRIEDNGIGFDYKHFNRVYGHYGIMGMKERAKAINGMLEIESRNKCGTCITLIVPVEN